MEDRERNVIPRWRSSVEAARFGEIAPLKSRNAGAFPESLLSNVLEDWIREPSLSVAADVVACAIAIGQPEAARTAAQVVARHKSAPPAAVALANRCLPPQLRTEDAVLPSSFGLALSDEPQLLIHRYRRRLAELPRNPILWTNLSLIYTTLGIEPQARRAMRIAIGLAPNNRFVARAASRLYLHLGDADHAHWTLLHASTLKSDPWLLAAEIATASAVRRTPRSIKQARRAIESQNFSEFSLSELLGALATLEASAGSIRKSRRLCALAMRNPAENAIAQAAWLERNIDSAAFSPLIPQQISSNEALAWAARLQGDWRGAVEHSKLWQSEQLFSSRPAIFASHAAATGLENFEDAEAIARRSLAANKDDAALLNNLAFACAKQGKTEDAREVLSVAAKQKKNPLEEISLKATAGLVEFRSGNWSLGRNLYNAAIAAAKASKLGNMAAIAQVYLAIEESRVNSPRMPIALGLAAEGIAGLPEPLRSTFEMKLKQFGAVGDPSA